MVLAVISALLVTALSVLCLAPGVARVVLLPRSWLRKRRERREARLPVADIAGRYRLTRRERNAFADLWAGLASPVPEVTDDTTEGR